MDLELFVFFDQSSVIYLRGFGTLWLLRSENHQAEVFDSKAGAELLDIILKKYHYGGFKSIIVGIFCSRPERKVAAVPEDVGTTGALRAIGHHLTAHDILVMSGDLVCDVPPGAVAAAHRRHDAVVTAMLCSARVSGPSDSGSAGGKDKCKKPGRYNIIGLDPTQQFLLFIAAGAEVEKDIRVQKSILRAVGQMNGDDDSVAKMKAAEDALQEKEKQKPSFELSGKLASETNRVRGVTLLFNEPPDARKPDIRWRLYVFKAGEVLNGSDLLILKTIKQSVEPRNSVCHSATIYANAIMHAGTTVDTFLRENLHLEAVNFVRNQLRQHRDVQLVRRLEEQLWTDVHKIMSASSLLIWGGQIGKVRLVQKENFVYELGQAFATIGTVSLGVNENDEELPDFCKFYEKSHKLKKKNDHYNKMHLWRLKKNLGFSISITSPMGELKIKETSLSALFNQARKIHLSASESGIDQLDASLAKDR
ncbi:unnamed protein product [Camellia sinensis]